MSSVATVNAILRTFDVNSWLSRVMWPFYRVVMNVDCTLLQSGPQVIKVEGGLVNGLKTHVLMYVNLLAYIRLCIHADYADSIVLTR